MTQLQKGLQPSLKASGLHMTLTEDLFKLIARLLQKVEKAGFEKLIEDVKTKENQK